MDTYLRVSLLTVSLYKNIIQSWLIGEANGLHGWWINEAAGQDASWNAKPVGVSPSYC